MTSFAPNSAQGPSQIAADGPGPAGNQDGFPSIEIMIIFSHISLSPVLIKFKFPDQKELCGWS